MKKILSLCICLCMMLSTFTFAVHASGSMDVTLTSSRYGHIYTDPNQGFRIDVKNNLSGDFSGKIVYNILSNGTSIYSVEKEVNIAVGGSYTDFPVIEFPKYGIFELKASVTDGTTVYGTASIPFSYINASEPGEGNMRMNANTHMSVYDNGEEAINALRDAGFGGFRDGVCWFQVEEHNRNEYQWPEYLDQIKTAALQGQEPLVILSGGNGPWDVKNEAEGNLNMAPDNDTERQAFANYCAYVAKEFKGYVKYYEIWNEFDGGSSNAGDTSGENYAQLLVAASKAIKAVDPDAKIVAMCTTGMNRDFINDTVKKLKSMGEANCYDIVSVHPYTYGSSYGTPNTITLSLIKSIVGSKPIWFSERGWDTAVGSTEYLVNGITDEKQAEYGVKDYLTFVSGNYCDRWFWYDFQDDGTNATSREDNYGIIESVNSPVPGAAKPAYVAFAAMNKLIGQSTYKSVSTSGNAKAYRFVNSKNEDTYVLTGNVGNSITVNMSGKLELLDMYSNVVAIDDNTDGSFKVTLTDEVMYVRKHFEPAGCSVTVSGNELIVKGHAEDDDKQISVMVTSAEGKYVYMGQTTCDSERAYSFTADRKGINELYVKVNYGSLFSSEVQTGFVLKLICNDERIFSLENVTATDNIKLVITVNDAITTDTDVHTAVYSGNELQSFETITFKPGTAAGDYSVDIKIEDNNVDKVQGFVWENMNPVMDSVDFTK